ncbi:response regulator [Candidatus Contendibacter odensensis]|uniref:Response regulator receiver protein n=1 Tax=Candidatus Contendobacter odensis Run_B_J11 TaxID=1400861 RepID=A0A7U7GET7_9GAMM|nr:response regulator [Candidatus Contendobacter odensis]MBK8754096.1 response regulator [Candidatus Competibacteraceae bacterium]CDH46873.1 Response regulator receiver protein [Candidatus Contendobacter odensis Run_B_J11]
MKTIFLVDDSATMLMSLSEILQKAGFTVQTAADGADALSQFKAGAKPDLVITDQNMPGLTGIELIRETRKLPTFRFTPILMLTTESQQAKRQEGKAAGATGWLVKPVAGKDLLGVIKQVLPGA